MVAIKGKAYAKGLVRKNVMIINVGALADEFYRDVSVDQKKHVRVLIPSAAIGVLDWIKATSESGLVIATRRRRTARIGGQKTLVQVIVDPTVKRNIHAIVAEEAAEKIFNVESVPARLT
jgi:predicted dinucleotide-utilizing enzyme